MAKNNKPIYKRVWPYIVIIGLIGAGAGGAASSEPDEDRGEFAEKRTVITITPEPGEKDTFSIADIVEETPEPLELLEPETTRAPVTRSAPEVPQPVEETTQETTEEPAEEPSEENIEYVYVSTGGNGQRYHKNSNCTGSSVKEIPIDLAIASGYTPCKKCAGG